MPIIILYTSSCSFQYFCAFPCCIMYRWFLQCFCGFPHFCSSTQTHSDLSVWSMCRGIRGAQLQYWCRTLYNPFSPPPLHLSLRLIWHCINSHLSCRHSHHASARHLSPPSLSRSPCSIISRLPRHFLPQWNTHILDDPDPQRRQ